MDINNEDVDHILSFSIDKQVWKNKLQEYQKKYQNKMFMNPVKL